jgi:transcription elongation factor SPT6
VDYKKAEQILGRMSQGDCIVRPSSKGSDHLTLTWKVNPAILAHVDIIEKNKDNPFGLGKQLIIDKETYEDLDEIIARYVTPMAQFARELINFRYFRNAEGGKKELMEGYLNAARQEQPNKIHYFVAASRERPGKFILSYLPRTKCIHEYITVTPEGYRYRQRIFSSVNQLFKWFKEHFRDPPPQPSPAAMMISTPGMGTPGGIILSDRAGSVQAMRTPTQTPLANFGGHVRPPGNYYPSPMAAPRTPAQQTPGGSFIKPGVPMRKFLKKTL